MTEFKYVTTEVISVNRTKFNSSPSKLYVDLDDGDWDGAMKALKQLFDAKKGVLKGHAGRIYGHLWKLVFASRFDRRTLAFWEDALTVICNAESVDAPSYVTEQLKAAFGECLGVMINHNCILLPFVPARSENTPKWHSNKKPLIQGLFSEPVALIAEGLVGKDGKRRVRSATNLLFSSLKLVELADFTPALNDLMNDVASDNLPDASITLVNHTKEAIVRLGVQEGVREYFEVRRVRNVPVVYEDRLAFLAERTQYVPKIDQNATMERFLSESLEKWRIQERDSWIKHVSAWALSKQSINLKRLYTTIPHFWKWMSEQSLNRLSATDFKRSMFVRSKESAEIGETFYEYLSGPSFDNYQRKKINHNIIDFFAHVFDALSDERGEVFSSPLKESDSKRYIERGARGSGKSNKPVVPRKVIELAKEIILEDDYKFAKSLGSHWGYDRSGNAIFCPTLSNILFLILSVPIRTAQALMLDSGEADELEVSIDGKSVENLHPLMQRGRRLGFLRVFSDDQMGTNFVGLFVNTNKESAVAQKGYEIPYHDPRLMKVLQYQLDWQKVNNPVSVLVDRSQIGPSSLRYSGPNCELAQYTFLFRDLTKHDHPWDLPSAKKVYDFWLLVLSEAQERLAAQGEKVILVYEDEKGSLRTDFTLHSLRVSNITHFVEVGVPLHVLAEFLSGHHTLLMTLYYTKVGAVKINKVIQKARQNLLETEEDEFFDELTRLAESEVPNFLVGKQDALSYVPNGNPGLWHIDLDGICVAGKSRCLEGMQRRSLETGSVSYEPIYPDSFNCALCRFHMTGPAFLEGQVTTANTLLYAIQQRSEAQAKLFEQKDAAIKSNNKRQSQRLQDQWDKIEVELEPMIASLGARIGNIYSSLKLLNDQDDGEDQSTALITRLDEPEISASLSEVRSVEQIEFVSQAVEFFPQLPDNGASVRKGTLLDQLALKDGIQPLLLNLSLDDRLKAANRLTRMMSKIYGDRTTIDLLEGKETLSNLGITRDFEALLGEAVKLDKPERLGLGSSLNEIEG